MASVAILQQPNDAVAAMPKIVSPSKLELSRPFTNKIRRIITNETDKLIKTRSDLDDALQETAERGEDDLKTSDRLSREDVLKLSDALTRRESKHLRLRNKLIEKRKQLYKWDPSPERKVDLELLQALQWNFKRNLTTCLSVREQSLRPHMAGNTASTSCEARDQDEDMRESIQAPGSSSKNVGVAHGGSDTEELEGDRPEAVSNLDGAFDDFARQMTKKRKASDEPNSLRAEKEQKKRARKERTADIKQTTCSGSQSLQSSLSISSPREGPDNGGDKAAIDSMFQPNTKPHVNGKEACVRPAEPKSDNTATSTLHDTIASAKAKGTGAKVTQTQSSFVKISDNKKEPLVEPWYKLHARAMMDPDFDDLVFHRPNRKRKRPQSHSDVYVHGALRDLRDIVSDDTPLPTPPLSSPSLSPSPPTKRKTSKVDNPSGETNRRTNKAQPNNSQTNYRPSIPESTTVSIPTKSALRSVQEDPSNALSAP